MPVMTKKVEDKIVYLIAVISEFASAHSLNTAQAYRYLDRFGGIDFICSNYEAEHTLSFDDAVADLTYYCQRRGGALR